MIDKTTSHSFIFCFLSIIFLFLFLPIIHNAHATDVSGFISSDTTWTLANSPYIVTGSVLLNSGVEDKR